MRKKPDAHDLRAREHEAVRDTAAKLVADYALPHLDGWNEQGAVDRDLYRKAAALGLIGYAIRESFGGTGIDDYRFSAGTPRAR